MIGKDFRQYHPDRVMSYGKHAGKKYRDVPSEYLKWVSEQAFNRIKDSSGNRASTRVEWAKLELERREKNLL